MIHNVVVAATVETVSTSCNVITLAHCTNNTKTIIHIISCVPPQSMQGYIVFNAIMHPLVSMGNCQGITGFDKLH